MNILVIGAIALGGVAAWFLLGKPTSIEGIQAGIEGITSHANAGFTSYSRGGGYGGGTTITGPGFIYQRGGGPGGGVSMHGVPPPGFIPGGVGGFYPPPYPVPMDSIRGGNFGSAPIFGAGPEYGLEGKIGQSPYANPLPSMGDGAALPPFVGGIGTSPFVPGQPFPGSIGASPYPGYGFPSPPPIYPAGGLYGLPPPYYGGYLRHGGYEFGGRMRGHHHHHGRRFGGYPFQLPDPYSHPYGYLGGYPEPEPGVFRPGPRRFHGEGFGFGDHDHDHDAGNSGGLLGNIFGGIFGR